MNTTSLSTLASAASLPSFNGAVSMWSPATSIVQAAAESRSFWATARTWLRDLFTPSLMRDVERGTALSALGRFYAQRTFVSTNGRQVAALHNCGATIESQRELRQGIISRLETHYDRMRHNAETLKLPYNVAG